MKITLPFNFLNSIRLLSFLILLFLFILPKVSSAEIFRFKIKNTCKSNLTVYYQVFKGSGNSKVHSLFKIQPSEERVKLLNLKFGDTVSFYGQNNQNETSTLIKKNFNELLNFKEKECLIPLIIPVNQSASFESLENLGLKIEHNKVLNFLVKADTNMVGNLSFLEDNFKNIYPLGTFLFVDTKTKKLLIPPLEPSFWNQNETYLSIQDSIDEMVNTSHQAQGSAQLAFFLANLFSSLKMEKTWEINFNGKISLVRWKPAQNANLYQIFNDRSVLAFLQNCYELINDPDKEFQRYRLYFLSSYERIDYFQIYGKQFFDWNNSTNLSIASTNPAFQLMGSNLGMVYSKDKTLTNYFSVQNAVMKTKVYDFTPQLFREFKAATRQKILEETYSKKHSLEMAILGEYENLINYNPNPKVLTLAHLTKIDSSNNLTPIMTTVKEISPFNLKVLEIDSVNKDTPIKEEELASYNFKVKLFNSHLNEINSLFKNLDYVSDDLEKLSLVNKQSKSSNLLPTNARNSPSEIEVSTSLAMKE